MRMSAVPTLAAAASILLLTPSCATAQSGPLSRPLQGPLKVASALAALPKAGAVVKSGAIMPPEALWQKIQAANAADLKYAKALADAAASPGAKLRSACYGAWIATIEQTQGASLKDAGGNPLARPEPHVFAAFEQMAEIAEALQPTGPLMTACAPAWTALKLTAAQFFAMAVSGAVGLSALGIGLP